MVEELKVVGVVRDAMKEKINPKHYKKGKVECIDAIESCTKEMQGFDAICVANIIKYLWRFPFKHNNPQQDLLKAKWYLERLIDAQNKTKDK